MTMRSSGDVTRLLQRWGEGDAQAMGALLPLLYDELRRLAAVYMRRQPQGHTLQPTALVNEAYLKLAGQEGLSFADRASFFGLAVKREWATARAWLYRRLSEGRLAG